MKPNEVQALKENKTITIRVKRRNITIDINTILYILMDRKYAEVHVLNGDVYVTRITCGELSEALGEGFMEIRRGCMVSVIAIYKITKTVELSNGERLNYTPRRRKEIISVLHEKQKKIISGFSDFPAPADNEEYRRHYGCFENVPFAFTDIEIVFDEERQAADWIFRYGNKALAKLEKTPLEKLIGSSFGSIFYNMDEKWLRSYQRSALFGETIEMIDYSPEIDAYLKIISFPTFKGHCGCILFDINDIKYIPSSPEAQKALRLYFSGASESEG